MGQCLRSRSAEYLPVDLPGWTESQREVREAIAKICSKYPDEYWMKAGSEEIFPWELYKDLSSAGWLRICLPEEYGGSGLGISEAAVMLQTIAESGTGMNGASSVHMNIFALEPVERSCFGVTEPNTGLNTLQLQSTAKKSGDYYTLKGSKLWFSTAQIAENILVLVRTTPIEECQKLSQGLSLFYTDLNRNSVQVTKIPKMGRNAVDSNALFFEDWKVSAENLIGEEGAGFRMIMHGLDAERVLVGAETLGIGFAALRRASNYAAERSVFGNLIGKYQGIQHPLAECWMNLEAARLTLYLAGDTYNQGYESGEYANTDKFLASEAAFKAAERAILTHGGMGYAKEYHVERYLKEAMLSRIAPISGEMIKNYVGQRVLGLPKSY
ncbi:acyl-dehydrogenase domain-containing protein [Paraphoma chrysanthemicola]|uniref:Acyl-dehydrogenase domain-containing protein n=1 Tax=Paraphoma chrysanthemicola TaxID=798071 RepID=A0A8K0W168_9PLEO|nr:acyl-dehydrogenase domain-containing protein [Paraphoma chrysanthemicola]